MSVFDGDVRDALIPDIFTTFGKSGASYTVEGGSAVAITCVPRANPLEEVPRTGGRFSGYSLMVLVKKSDVPVVLLGGDTVTVPQAWLNQSGGSTVVLRVVAIDGERTTDTAWSLQLQGAG